MTARPLILLASHGLALLIGFAAGIYALPILTAPPSPDSATLARDATASAWGGRFARERADSDALHYGDGEFSIGADAVRFIGRISPGPDFRLYLSPEFVETAADFERLKPRMVQVGDVRTFDNFLVPMKPGIDPAQYSTAIVWCESFGQFITSGTYARRATAPTTPQADQQ